MDLQQWERILESTNHYQRLKAEAVRYKASEEKRIKWLKDKNISERSCSKMATGGRAALVPVNETFAAIHLKKTTMKLP